MINNEAYDPMNADPAPKPEDVGIDTYKLNPDAVEAVRKFDARPKDTGVFATGKEAVDAFFKGMPE